MGAGGRVRVLVADDHPLYREALADTVRQRPDLELVAKVASGREALAEIRDAPPDVAVLEVKMPDLDGTDLVDAVTRDDLPTRVVLLSAFVDSALAYPALGAGAAGDLSKASTGQRIYDRTAGVLRRPNGPDPAGPARPAHETP